MDRKYTDMLVDLIVSIIDRKEIKRIDLAKRIGVTEQSLGRYLLKVRPLPLEVAVLLAIELKIDLNSLFQLTENPLNEEEYITYLKFKEIFNATDDEQNSSKK